MNKLKSIINKKSFLITSLIMVIGILITIINIIPNDYWWHVKAGEYMVSNKTIPFIDVFSWYGIENNLYWHSHEWLSEVVYYIISIFNEQVSVTIFVTICVCILFFVLYKANNKLYENHLGFSLFWIISGACLFSKLISPRPHMISFIFFALVIWMLYYFRNNENSKIIWCLPLVSILWVNFHGGSSNLPYVLTLLFIMTGLFNFNLGKLKFDKLTNKQLKIYFYAGALSFFALLLNPHGIDMISYPYLNMNDMVMLSFIGEWRSPNLKIMQDILFVFPIVTSVLIFMKTRKDILFVDFALIGAFSYLTLKSIRFSAFLYIVASFIIFKYLSEIKLENIKIKILKELQSLLPVAIKKLYIVAIGSLSVFLGLVLTTNPIKETFSRDALSSEMIDTIKQVNPERLYNDYNYGGYLIYSGIQPMIDGRADMYSATLLEDYIQYANFLNPKLRERYDFDYLLVDKNLTLDNYFSSNPNDYEKLLEDERCILYKNLKYQTKPVLEKIEE